MQAVVLASGSQYRAQLLRRLGVEFRCISPDIDEHAADAESPSGLSQRLAREKALAVQFMLAREAQQAAIQPPATNIIIASDQVASCDGVLLGKPGTANNACAQLAGMSGRCVDFYTSLYMLDTASGQTFDALDTTRAQLRALDSAAIQRYVNNDQPLDCAGSFKVESLGISLFESVTSDDPTALIGLPMIKLCEGLRLFGLAVP